MSTNEKEFVTLRPTESQGGKRNDQVSLERFRNNHEPIVCNSGGNRNDNFQTDLCQPSTSRLDLNIVQPRFYCCDNDSSSEDEDVETFTQLECATEQKCLVKYNDGVENKSSKCQTDSKKSKSENMPTLDLFVRHFGPTVVGDSSENESSESEGDNDNGTGNRTGDGAIDTHVTDWAGKIHNAIAVNSKQMRGFIALEIALHNQLTKIAKRRDSIFTAKMPRGISGCKKLNWKYNECFFRDPEDNSRPPPNADILKMKANGEVIICNQRPFTRWMKTDKIKLKAAVVKVLNKKTVSSSTEGEKETNFVAENETDIDWEAIADSLSNRHSAGECRGMWVNHILPTAKCKRPYTKREGVRLQQIAEGRGKQDWDAIASDLDTGRSGLQCFILYTSELERRMGYLWTKDEDETLIRLVNQHSDGNRIDWPSVSFGLPGRDLTQVMTHWKYTANPHIKKGRFSKEEDIKLFRGIRLFGTNFSKIVKHFLPERTNPQVRCHYLLLSSNIGSGKWSRQEDKALLYLANKYKESNWNVVSQHFVAPTRNSRQVRARYQILKRWTTDDTVPKQRQSRQLQTWLKRQDKLKGLTEYSNMPIIIRRRRQPKPRLPKTQVDLDLEEFLRVNFVERRTERLPGSLERAFILPDEEVKARAHVTKQLLDILRTNVDLSLSEEAIMDDVSVSNHDKMVFAHINKLESSELVVLNQRQGSSSLAPASPENDSSSISIQGIKLEIVSEETVVIEGEESLNRNTAHEESASLEGKVTLSQRTPLLTEGQEPSTSGVDCSLEHFLAQPSTSSHVPTECSSDSTNIDPVPTVDLACNPHSEFLLPDRGTLAGLSTMLLDPFLNRSRPNPLFGKETQPDEETKTAVNLWMERMKTVFLYPILLPPEIAQEEARKIEAENNKRKEEEEQRKQQMLEVAVKKKIGRPPKRRRKKIDTEEAPPSLPPPPPPPKRKYRKTGKYSSLNNIAPRSNLRSKADKTDSKDPNTNDIDEIPLD